MVRQGCKRGAPWSRDDVASFLILIYYDFRIKFATRIEENPRKVLASATIDGPHKLWKTILSYLCNQKTVRFFTLEDTTMIEM